MIVVATVGCGADGSSPAGDLASRLASAEDPERYSFDDESALAAVVESAVGAPQRFSADVDLETGVMEVESARRADGLTLEVADD